MDTVIKEGKELGPAIKKTEDNLSVKTDKHDRLLNGQQLSENEYPLDLTPFKQHNGVNGTLSSKLGNVLSRNPDEAGSHNLEEIVSHKSDEAKSQKLEEVDSYELEEANSQKLEDVVSYKPEESNSLKFEQVASHKLDEAKSQKLEEVASYKLEEANSQKLEDVVSYKPEESNSHKLEQVASHKLDEAKSQKLEEVDSHKLEEANSQKFQKIPSHKPYEGFFSYKSDETVCIKSEEVIPHIPKITVSCLEENTDLFKSQDAVTFKTLKTVNNEVPSDENDDNNNISKSRRFHSAKSSRKSQPWVTKLTKKELDALLPSRSHFSCHEKALREAGYIPEEIEKRKIERKERRKLFRDRLFKARCGQNNLDNNTSNDGTSLRKEPNDSDLNDKPTPRYRKKQDELPIVEHKALTEYLRYVKENSNEYFEHLSRRQTPCENWAVRNLIKTAMVFQRGHHGVPYTTPTVRASHTLNPRFADPGLWQQLNKELTSKRLVRMDSSISKLPAEKEKETKVDSDEPKTDYEKVLSRAEKWVKTVSTAQFLRARQEALKEVEEEDTDVTKWWINMKKCNYIRTNSSMSD